MSDKNLFISLHTLNKENNMKFDIKKEMKIMKCGAYAVAALDAAMCAILTSGAVKLEAPTVVTAGLVVGGIGFGVMAIKMIQEANQRD